MVMAMGVHPDTFEASGSQGNQQRLGSRTEQGRPSSVREM
jgi:hypothetical protein